MSVETIIGAVTLILGASNAVLLWFQWRSASKVQTADATQKIGMTYDQLLDNLNERIKNLELKVKKFEKWVPMLIDQIYQLGGVPVSPPDTDELNKK